jgi:hypothetical protein
MFSSELARSRSAEAFQHALRICGRRGDEVAKARRGRAARRTCLRQPYLLLRVVLDDMIISASSLFFRSAKRTSLF